MTKDALQGRPIKFNSGNGYGSNIAQIAKAAPIAGHFDSIAEADGVVRYRPLNAGSPSVSPDFPNDRLLGHSYQGLESIQRKLGSKTRAIPVDDQVSALIPFSGFGGPSGGAFRYVSAADLLSKVYGVDIVVSEPARRIGNSVIF